MGCIVAVDRNLVTVDDVPAGCPKYSIWAVTAVHIVTRERKTRLVKFTGSFPTDEELEHFCPSAVCTIMELNFLHSVWENEDAAI